MIKNNKKYNNKDILLFIIKNKKYNNKDIILFTIKNKINILINLSNLY